MKPESFINSSDSFEMAQRPSNANPINIKRILARLIHFWYLIVLSVALSLTAAFLVNRYSTRIYTVRSSIIINENEQSVGADLLYSSNELTNPSRNFYNELYIMKSYPLLEEVMEELNFTVSFHREGDIKTTEFYDKSFPVKISNFSKSPSGKSLYFTIISKDKFALRYGDPGSDEKQFNDLKFNDTVHVNGHRIYVEKKGDVSGYINKTFLIAFRDPMQLAISHSNRLKVTWAELGSSVVNLEIDGPVQQKAIDFLNKFMERYQNYDIEKKNQVYKMAIRFLDNQLNIIGDSLKLYEDQVEAFKRKNIITNMDQETERLYQKMMTLEDQKLQYKLLENYYTYVTDLLKTDNYDGVFTPSSVGINDEVVAELITQLIAEQSLVNLFKSNATRDKAIDKTQQNPAMLAKLEHINLIKADILKTIENSRKTQAINSKFINDQIILVEDQLRKLPSTERELIGIQRNYSLRENLYTFLLQKRAETGLSEASTTSDIIVVNPPLASGPITPKVSQNYIVALAIGFLFPILFFTLAEFLNNRIQSREDIEQLTTVPVIGGIGHNPVTDSLVVVSRPRSAMAESFRALRSNLNYFTAGLDHQVFMVTSSIPGEGKSFTTLNLASVFALSGKRTLVIGADLRKPKLYEELHLKNAIGLSQYLSSMATLQEIIQESTVENLYLISGGTMPPNPSELLLKPAMADMIAQLRGQFDCIILDTPPLGLVTDAFVLVPLVNHILFVVRQDYTPRSVLQALEEYYSKGKFAKVSILFNDLRKTGLGYGYGNYGYNYGYGYNYDYGYYNRKSKGDGSAYYSD